LKTKRGWLGRRSGSLFSLPLIVVCNIGRPDVVSRLDYLGQKWTEAVSSRDTHRANLTLWELKQITFSPGEFRGVPKLGMRFCKTAVEVLGEPAIEHEMFTIRQYWRAFFANQAAYLLMFGQIVERLEVMSVSFQEEAIHLLCWHLVRVGFNSILELDGASFDCIFNACSISDPLLRCLIDDVTLESMASQRDAPVLDSLN
jgi:hypothetical protein